MPWYYYNDNNERTGPIRSRELKDLAQQGIITPETKVEDSEGRTALAKKVTGLKFAESPQSKVEDLGEQDFVRLREDIVRLHSHQEKQRQVPQASSALPPPSGVNPFSAPMPGTPPVGVNPFAAPVPPVKPAVPVVPVPDKNRRPFGEIMSSVMRKTMNFIASTMGLILALLLAVFVVWLLYSLLVMSGTAPAPPVGSWIERVLIFGNPYGGTPYGEVLESQTDSTEQHSTEQHGEDVVPNPSQWPVQPQPGIWPPGQGRTHSGIADPDSRLVRVEGQIRYRGTPIAGATVIFMADNGSGEGASGTTDANGRYRLTSGFGGQNAGLGIAAGTYIVCVQKVVRTETNVDPDVAAHRRGDFDYDELQRRLAARGGERGVFFTTEHLLPHKYVSPATTPLRATVERGGVSTLNFNLTDN